MADAGIEDLLLANEISTPGKIERIAALAGRARVSVAVDDLEPVLALSSAAKRPGTRVRILIDLDVGLGRCEVGEDRRALDLAFAVSRAQALEFAGIMGYEGRLRASLSDRPERLRRAFDRLASAVRNLESAGLEVQVVSGAGTRSWKPSGNQSLPRFRLVRIASWSPTWPGLNLPFQCAVFVVASVISRSRGRVVLDAGRRTIGCDQSLPIPLAPNTHAISVSDEHVVLAWEGEPPALGTAVRLRPAKNRTTFNLYDCVWLARGDEIVERIPVAARGRSQ